jgi:DNA (cytosine-5)-methyltransferase 1
MEQVSLFEYTMPTFKIDKPVRLIELFAGIGSQAKALERIGVPFEHWKVVEFDKYAMASYNAVHGTNFETSDIRGIHAEELDIRERERYCYILTYSFPCQDLSLAGHGKGMSKGSGTRSGLLWEVERILDECVELPQVLLMENVPPVVQKYIDDFLLWRRKLESLGYSNYVELLNAKDYGIPQSRNRCFMVSILGDYFYQFPKKQKLKLKLKDMLEDNVDEKYYLSNKTIASFIAESNKSKAKGNGFKFEPLERERERAKTILAKPGQRKDDNFILEHCDPTCTWMVQGECGGDRCDKHDRLRSRGQVAHIGGYIRKLTPRECWRLMGFDDEDFDKAAKVCSDTRLYSQAGNSIVVNVLEAIFKQMIKE